MITGFCYALGAGEWKACYKTKNSWTFKPIYEDELGYFIKIGSKKKLYLNKEETVSLNKEREALKKRV